MSRKIRRWDEHAHRGSALWLEHHTSVSLVRWWENAMAYEQARDGERQQRRADET